MPEVLRQLLHNYKIVRFRTFESTVTASTTAEEVCTEDEAVLWGQDRTATLITTTKSKQKTNNLHGTTFPGSHHPRCPYPHHTILSRRNTTCQLRTGLRPLLVTWTDNITQQTPVEHAASSTTFGWRIHMLQTSAEGIFDWPRPQLKVTFFILDKIKIRNKQWCYLRHNFKKNWKLAVNTCTCCITKLKQNE